MTRFIAHRGLSAEVTQNTLAAFEAAYAAGFRAMELDVRLTADGVPIVLHDAGIEAVTGDSGRAADLPLAELQSHETPDGPIPTLAGVFEAFAGREVWLDIEIKELAATLPVLALVEQFNLDERGHISSMDMDALDILRGKWDHFGAILWGEPDDDDLHDARGAEWLHLLEVDIDDELLERLHRMGFKVSGWTINEVERAKELVAMGIDGIITDTAAVLEGATPTPP